MRYLPIKKVEAGMVLAQDILDGQGVMLLGRHQILNQEQLENLQFVPKNCDMELGFHLLIQK